MERNCEEYCMICMMTINSETLKKHIKRHEKKAKKQKDILQEDTLMEAKHRWEILWKRKMNIL